MFKRTQKSEDDRPAGWWPVRMDSSLLFIFLGAEWFEKMDSFCEFIFLGIHWLEKMDSLF